MKLRLDLLEHLTDKDILEEVLANNHRYKPEPNFSKTGVGTLSSASTKERAQEAARQAGKGRLPFRIVMVWKLLWDRLLWNLNHLRLNRLLEGRKRLLLRPAGAVCLRNRRWKDRLAR